jgi:hypothetical protein
MSKAKAVEFPESCYKMHIIQFNWGNSIEHHYRPGHFVNTICEEDVAGVFIVTPATNTLEERMLLRAGKTIERWRTPDGNVHQFIFQTPND